MARLKLIDCIKKAKRLPRDAKRSLVGRAREYISEGMEPIDASKMAVNEFLEMTQENIRNVQSVLKSTLIAPLAPEVKPLTDEQAKLVSQNLDLSGAIARKFDNIPMTSYDERNSEARFGLIKAAQNYDPDKNTNFRAYARRVIKNTLTDLYKKKAKQNKREISANIPLNVEESSGETLQDTLTEAEPEAVPDQSAIEIIANVRSKMSDRDQKILNDFASGLVLRDVAELNNLSHEGARKIIKRAGQQIIQALADAGITDINNIFPPVEQRQRASAKQVISPEDENADTSETVGRLEAQDIAQSEPIIEETGDENLVSALSPEGQETKVPWLRVKDGAYKPLGKLFSAAGRWSKELWAFQKDKVQHIAGAVTNVQMIDRQLDQAYKKYYVSQGAKVPSGAINIALGNTGNTYTSVQVKQARRIGAQAKRDFIATLNTTTLTAQDKLNIQNAELQAKNAFLLTAKMENLEAFKKLQEQTMASLPPEIQDLVQRMKSARDQLSRELIKSGAVSDNMAYTIGDNLETYLHRSYRIFDDPKGKWVEFVRNSDDPEAELIRNRAEAVFTAQARSEAALEYAREQRDDGNPITKAQAMNFVRHMDVSSRVNELLTLYTQVGDESVIDVMRGRLPGQKNMAIIKVRQEIPSAIRALWGEHDDPSINFAKTYVAIASFLANHEFTTRILDDGLTRGYIWKKGVSKGPIPDGFVPVVGESSESMSPMEGTYGVPMLRDALKELGNIKTEQDWISNITLAAMKAKTVFSLQAVIRNFLGNPAFIIANGNLTRGSMISAGKTAFANFRKLGTNQQREYISKLTSLGVLGDNVGPGMLNELKGRSHRVFSEDSNAVIELWRNINETAQGIYSGVDDFWKVYAFEAELSKLKEAEPTTPVSELEKQAAAIVRRTMPTYSEAFKVTSDLFKGTTGKLVAPFVTFTTEVIRVTGGSFAQVAEELHSDNPVIRKIGAKRLAGIIAIAAAPTILGQASKMVFGYDDDDEEAIRRGLPSWQKNASLVFLPRNKDGQPRFIDISYLNPYNYFTDPIGTVINAVHNGKSFSETAINIGVNAASQLINPFIGEQLAIGAINDVRRNQKALGGEVFNPQDDWGTISLKSAWHIAKVLEPGTITSLTRIYKAGTGYIEHSGRSYDLLSEAVAPITGQRIVEYNPTQTFKFQMDHFNRDRQDASKLFGSIFGTEGTISKGDIANAYNRANRAEREVVQDLYEDFKAAQKLGVPIHKAIEIMKSKKVGNEMIAQVVNGTYRQFVPGAALLKEIKGKYPERYMEFIEAFGKTSITEPLE